MNQLNFGIQATQKKNELIMDKGGYNIIRKTFYYIGFLFLLGIFFFEDNLPLFIKNNKGLIAGTLLLFTILAEVIKRKKNAD